LVELLRVARPVAVVAARLLQRVPPHVGDRRRDPHRRRAQPLDVVELVDDPLQIAARVLVEAGRVVLAFVLVVVGGIAVGETVDHYHVDDLFLPHRRRDVELLSGRRRACRGEGDEPDEWGHADRVHGALQRETPTTPRSELPEFYFAFFAGAAASANTYSCCASRTTSAGLPSASDTTNSKPLAPGSIVTSENDPSSFLRDATGLFHSPTSSVTAAPRRVRTMSPSEAFVSRRAGLPVAS